MGTSITILRCNLDNRFATKYLAVMSNQLICGVLPKGIAPRSYGAGVFVAKFLSPQSGSKI